VDIDETATANVKVNAARSKRLSGVLYNWSPSMMTSGVGVGGSRARQPGWSMPTGAADTLGARRVRRSFLSTNDITNARSKSKHTWRRYRQRSEDAKRFQHDEYRVSLGECQDDSDCM